MKLAKIKTILRKYKYDDGSEMRSVIDVVADKLDDNSVSTINIVNDAVTTEKIIDNAVTTSKILNDSVIFDKLDPDLKDMLLNKRIQKFIHTDTPNEDLYSDTIYNPTVGDMYLHHDIQDGHFKSIYMRTKYMDNKSTWTMIWSNDDPYVYDHSISDQAVTTDKIRNEAITSEKIAPVNILNHHIKDDAITTKKIVNDAVTTEKIRNKAVTSEKIADLNVLTQHIEDDAITTKKIVDDAINTKKILDDAIVTSKIKDNSVIFDKLDPDLKDILLNKRVQRFEGTDEPDKDSYSNPFNNPKVGDIYLYYNSTNGELKSIYVRTKYMADESTWTVIWSLEGTYVNEDSIFDNAITTNKLSDSSITTEKIADNAITTEKIADNAITTEKIINKAISIDKLDTFLNTMLLDERVQKFISPNAPTSDTYNDIYHNPKMGDIYIHYDINDSNGACIGIYIRTMYSKINNTSTWTVLWSNDAYINETAIFDNAITTNKIKDKSITEDKFSDELRNKIALVSIGTNPMNEGDELEFGHVYIQYDENI